MADIIVELKIHDPGKEYAKEDIEEWLMYQLFIHNEISVDNPLLDREPNVCGFSIMIPR